MGLRFDQDFKAIVDSTFESVEEWKEYLSTVLPSHSIVRYFAVGGYPMLAPVYYLPNKANMNAVHIPMATICKVETYDVTYGNMPGKRQCALVRLYRDMPSETLFTTAYITLDATDGQENEEFFKDQVFAAYGCNYDDGSLTVNGEQVFRVTNKHRTF